MNVETGKRLKSERIRLGMPPADFAVLCGIGRTTQFAYEAGDRAPDATYLQKAHEAGVDVQYVLTGTRSSSQESDFVVIKAHDVHASAGPGVVNGDHHDVDGLAFSRKWLASKGLSVRNLEVINVVGDSMSGAHLNDGDKVLVDTSDTQPKSGRVYVLRQGDELLVKFCQLLPEGVLRVSSANPHYASYDIDLSKTDGVSILGRVRASTHEW